MLYLMINGTPKCCSTTLRDAEQRLADADPDLYEEVHKVTCAYAAADHSENRRNVAIHTLKRALPAGTDFRWVSEGEHHRALECTARV